MRAGRLAVGLWLACAALASARPFTVEDLLGQASFGPASLSPGGRFLVYEIRPPYRQADRFDLGDWNGRSQARLISVDLSPSRPARKRPIGPAEGLALGPFAPSGERVVVYQLQKRRYRMGVAELASGQVRWLDINPLEAGRGRAVAWRSDRELLLLARTDAQAPEYARRGWIAAERLPAAWAAHAEGGVAATVLGSGRYAPVRARPTPMRLLHVDLGTGRTRELARGPFVDLEPSPDGGRVALLRAGPDLQAAGDQPVRGEAGSETQAHHLVILELQTGQAIAPLQGHDVLPQLLSWSPDGARLLVFTRGAGGLWTDGGLVTIDPATGVAARVGTDIQPVLDLNPVRIWTDWMGEDPLVFGRRRAAGGDRGDWFLLQGEGAIDLTAALPPPDRLQRIAGPGLLKVVAGGALWTVDGAGGSLERLEEAAVGVRIDPEVATTRPGRGPFDRLWLRLGGPEHPRLTEVTARGERTLPWEFGLTQPWAAADRFGAVRRDTDSAGVERLWLTRPGGRVELLETLNATLADADMPQVVPVSHLGPRDEPLTSWLFLPRGASAQTPLIVRPYLGANYTAPPIDPPPPSGFILNIRLLTSQGYAVLVPSLPNPSGGMTDPAPGLADRILAVVEAARRTPDAAGRFDPDRLGLVGFSFGGYSVMTTITQTRRFRAAVSISGVSDLTSYWASQSPFAFLDSQAGYVGNRMTGLVEATQPRMLGPPWAQAARYARNTPLLTADRIETPLLLIHGALDPVPHAGSAAMYSALFRQGKDAMLVTYWGALHGVSSPGDVRDMYARLFSFLDTRLAGAASRSAPEAAGVAQDACGKTPVAAAPFAVPCASQGVPCQRGGHRAQ
jgi:dipeptidyl aminopeptidase/acylaminoacyl peptidase